MMRPVTPRIAVDEPTNCIRQFPTLSADTVQLVAFDALGVARIRVEVSRGENLGEWERWLMRWLDRKYPATDKSAIGLVR